MSVPYTHGVWRVKPGRADDFVAAWAELAEWTAQPVSGARRATLLRDLADSDRFVSFGPWESLEAIEAWRSLEGFKERVGQISEMLVGFEPFTLELVVEQG